MFIVLPLHKESLRIMMQKGLASKDVKINVLTMLKEIAGQNKNSHGDIKDSFDFFCLESD